MKTLWRSGNFLTWYLTLCALLFVWIVVRAFTVPFSHDEAATFFIYVQSNDFLPFTSTVYTNNHFLNSVLSNLFYHLAGSHRLVLRLPNVLSFLILAWGVYRLSSQLKHKASKVLLLAFFLFNLHFLELFQLCRGYGMSMALMVLAFAALTEYFTDGKFQKLLVFSIALQFAISANLTLVVLALVLLAVVFAFQVLRHVFLKPLNLLLNLIQLFLLVFWLALANYYRISGVLDSGPGDNYWELTFLSLLNFMFGSKALALQITLIFLALFLMGLFISNLVRQKSNISVFQPGFFYTGLLIIMVLGAYLQKKILHINYPEDRTGLYLYLLFGLSIAFSADSSGKIFRYALAWGLGGAVLCSSYFCLNLDTFSYYFYHVFPRAFYSRMQTEQAQSAEPLTISGHSCREMVYAFMNYRGGGRLNPMDMNECMQMNCDYCIASVWEKPYYESYYTELLYDRYWDRALLKRKEKLVRTDLVERKDLPAYFSGKGEFTEFLRIDSCRLDSLNALEAEVELYFKKVPAPFKAFLVLSLANLQGKQVAYERVMLNWLADDLSGSSRKFRIPLAKAPAETLNLVLYLWNIDKKNADFTLVRLRLQELSGPGVNVIVPESYYPLLEKTIQKPML
ncbi:MAG TPA: hypothetical protein PLQ93_06280 [Bacteroidia bacterium]|nr:hypothetical protein [Bacteroidia bacterium]